MRMHRHFNLCKSPNGHEYIQLRKLAPKDNGLRVRYGRFLHSVGRENEAKALLN
jgi:hypothetical protein